MHLPGPSLLAQQQRYWCRLLQSQLHCLAAGIEAQQRCCCWWQLHGRGRLAGGGGGWAVAGGRASWRHLCRPQRISMAQLCSEDSTVGWRATQNQPSWWAKVRWREGATSALRRLALDSGEPMQVQELHDRSFQEPVARTCMAELAWARAAAKWPIDDSDRHRSS